ncbi:MAG: F0F1 ATP synthase subunit B family protein [Syntrophales bacterium]
MRRRLGPGHSGMHDQTEPTGRQNSCKRRVILCLGVLIACIFRLTAVYASGGGPTGAEEGPNWVNFFWRSINFLVLAGVLYWFLAKKAKEFFTGRREGIRTALAEAVTARETAEKKFQEYSAKLDKATGEIEQIGEMIRSQGLSEKARIIEEARKAAEKMKEDTRLRMEQEFSKASQRLRVEAVRLSAQMAEELLRKHIRAADHETMVKDSIEKVVSKQ